MTYLGNPDGVKGFLFMRKDNSLFTGAHALFDEEVFPRCPDSDKRRAHVPVGEDFPQRDDDPVDPQDPSFQEPGGLPDDDDFPPPAPPAPHRPDSGDDGDDGNQNRPNRPHQRRDETPSRIPRPRRDITPQQQEPQAPRRSTRERRVPNRDNDTGRSRSDATSSDDRVPGSSSQPDSGAGASEDLGDDEARIEQLCREGGVGLITMLLSKAVDNDEDIPDTSNIRDWTFCDISKLPKAQQKD
ncbi:hypothetical protein BD626DRAFT_388346, partial [Schizophyllum amplum]